MKKHVWETARACGTFVLGWNTSNNNEWQFFAIAKSELKGQGPCVVIFSILRGFFEEIITMKPEYDTIDSKD
jgi:hypothetical protein